MAPRSSPTIFWQDGSAPGIRFVLPQHANVLQQTLTLGEASAVANAFYAFQRKLLK